MSKADEIYNLFNLKVKFKVNKLIRFGKIENVCINNFNEKIEKILIRSDHNNWYVRDMTEVEVIR